MAMSTIRNPDMSVSGFRMSGFRIPTALDKIHFGFRPPFEYWLVKVHYSNVSVLQMSGMYSNPHCIEFAFVLQET